MWFVVSHSITEVPNHALTSPNTYIWEPYNSKMEAFAPRSWHFKRDGKDTIFKQITTEGRVQNIPSKVFSDHFPSCKPQEAWSVMAANSVLGKSKFRVSILSFTILLWPSISNKIFLLFHAVGILTRYRIFYWVKLSHCRKCID